MGKSFLILDEDGNLNRMVAPLLESRGHKITHCCVGKEALEIVGQNSLDAVILGEQLKDIDGIGWIVRLRQVSNDIKIVYISNTWKEAELYQKLTKEFGVGLVVHRPLKPSLFGVQVESLFPGNGKVQEAAFTALAIPETDTRPQMPSGLEDTLAALKEKYIKVLPQRLDALTEAVRQAHANPDNQTLLCEARRLAHNLKGTAASSGFEPIGNAAAQIERSLDAVRSGKTVSLEDEWLLIEAAMQVASSEADSVSRQGLSGPRGERRFENLRASDIARARVLVVCQDDLPPPVNGSASALPVEIILAGSESEALEKARKLPLDAALIDMSMEGKHNPCQLARELRGLAGYENLPLGFILASSQPEDRIAATHAGASVYLVKPLDDTALHKAMHYLIGVREGGRSRVLIVDDDDDFSSLISFTLGSEGMLVRSIADPQLIEEMMEKFSPDLILLDVNMPGVSGFDVCRLLRSTPRWQDVPILFLTGETGLDARISAFDSGGDDYLPKPVANVELLTRVKVRLERSRMLKERTDKDVLTGLLLRRAFMEQLNSLLAEAQRYNLNFCVCLLDVDHFKKVNDTYGHLAGDRVLSHFGQLLKRRFRVEDLRGRWGGEEFILAFRHETKDTMKGALTRALDELSITPFQGDHGETFYTAFSAGMVSYPEDADNVHDLLQIADKRLYIAKETGRKRVVTDDEGKC